MSRLHVVVYSDADARGGAEVVLANTLAGMGPEVRVTLVGVSDAVVDWIGSHRPSAERIVLDRIAGRTDLAGMWRFRRLLSRLRPDIVQFNLSTMSSCQWAILAASTMSGIRLIVVEHSPVGTWSRSSALLKGLTSAGLSAHVAVGERAADLIAELGDLDRSTLTVVHHGVPELEPEPEAEPEAEPGAGGRIPVIGAVARHDPVKGLDVLLDALALLDRPFTATIIGDGPEHDALVAQRHRLGLDDRVEFVQAFGVEARRRQARFDVFVMPSRVEGFPVTTMEAMLAGVPMVVCDVGGIREQVDDGETALVVPPDDPAAMAAAIGELLADEGRRDELGRRARAVARERFTVEATVERYLALYRRVMAEPAPGPWRRAVRFTRRGRTRSR